MLALAALLLAASGQATLDEAAALFRSLEYEQALTRFEQASAAPDLGAPARASALVWVGVCRASLGDEGAARQDFQRALQLDRDVSYPPNAPPKVEALYLEVRAALPAATPEQAPASPPTATTTEAAPDPLPAIATIGLGVTAAATLAGAGVAALAGLAAAERSRQPGLFVDEVGAAVAEANLELGAAVVLAAAGAALTAGAGVAAWWWLSGPPDAASAATAATAE